MKNTKTQFKAQVTRACNAALKAQAENRKKAGEQITDKVLKSKQKRYDKLKNEACIDAMIALDIDSSVIDNFKKLEPSNVNSYLAQYAVDKFVRMLRAVNSGKFEAGTRGIDNYSITVVGNAIINNIVSYDYLVAQAGISDSVANVLPSDYVSKFRMKKQQSTAATQVSSTTRALCALGAAKIDVTNKSATINASHPFIVGVAKMLQESGAKIGDNYQS